MQMVNIKAYKVDRRVFATLEPKVERIPKKFSYIISKDVDEGLAEDLARRIGDGFRLCRSNPELTALLGSPLSISQIAEAASRNDTDTVLLFLDVVRMVRFCTTLREVTEYVVRDGRSLGPAYFEADVDLARVRAAYS